ncbi:MAG: LysR family transcriptional regulator [Oscillospiraceae bacterium]|jgi:DNA-binding transcriptional LysR family regulator|nr:LysR family transcriptional regulator [Oscillospiraceae bacterium]
MSLIKLAQIEQFMEVCRFQSVTKAAEHLFISQQALSRSIQRLEGVLGFELFRRSSHGMHLTDEGTMVYEKFSPIVRLFQEAESQITGKSGESAPAQTLSFSAAPGIIRSLSPEMVLNFCELYPGLKLDITEVYEKQIERYVGGDSRRFGLADIPEWMHDRRYNYIVLRTEPSYMLVHKNNPIASLPAVSLEALRNERVLVLSQDSYYQEALNSIVAQFGFSITPYFVSADMMELVGMVNRGLGVTLCIKQVYEEAVLNKCVLVPVQERAFDSNVTCVFQKFESLEPIAQDFIRYLQEKVGE